jgi:predicted HicB family RNase H-like nuclease
VRTWTGSEPQYLAKRRVSLEVTHDLYEAAKAKAQQEKMSVAEVLRTALEVYVDHDGPDGDGPDAA